MALAFRIHHTFNAVEMYDKQIDQLCNYTDYNDVYEVKRDRSISTFYFSYLINSIMCCRTRGKQNVSRLSNWISFVPIAAKVAKAIRRIVVRTAISIQEIFGFLKYNR